MFNDLVRENVPMKDYSTFKAGGNARFFSEPSDENELRVLLEHSRSNDIPVTVIGNGSNILVSDKGYDGLIIKIGKGFADLKLDKSDDRLNVEAGAGLLLSVFGNTVAREGYTGAEFCCGIPGSVGGAVFMNAGAYGREIKDIVTEVDAMGPDLTIKTLKAGELELGYRRSVFLKNGSIVLRARFTLEKGDSETIMNYVAELRGKRTASQPLEHPSAGSTFKRPEGHYAGALIQEAGLKGFALDDSGAMVSAKHAGFVVNIGGRASAADIYRLICYVTDKVYETSGVRLEPEVRLIGF